MCDGSSTHEVVRVAGDVDDARGRAGHLQQRPQQQGEQEVGEVVDAQLREALGGRRWAVGCGPLCLKLHMPA